MEHEDKYLKIFKKRDNKKTSVYSVWSKCGDFELGEIKWYGAWRHYLFIIDVGKIPLATRLLLFSDRCQIVLGEFTQALNRRHKDKQLRGKKNG